MVTAKPTPLNAGCPVGFTRPVTMPTTSPSLFTSGPPEDPGFTAASNWIRPVRERFWFGTWTDRSSPLITPVDNDRVRLNGLPTTIASSPIRRPDGFPSVAGVSCAGVLAAAGYPLPGGPAPSRSRREAPEPRVPRSREARGEERCGSASAPADVERPGRAPPRDGRAGTRRKAGPLCWARVGFECRHATFADGYGLSKKDGRDMVRTNVLSCTK